MKDSKTGLFVTLIQKFINALLFLSSANLMSGFALYPITWIYIHVCAFLFSKWLFDRFAVSLLYVSQTTPTHKLIKSMHRIRIIIT